MIDHAVWIVVGILAAALIVFAYLAAKKYVGPALAKIKTWWTKNEARFSALEADIKALKTKVGV